jgi:diguanylate cyclase (GGDEF)-like protein
VALIDLDRFKELNDSGGHRVGDRYLKQLAKEWTTELRGADLLARYGGDEFAMILPGCSLDTAEEVLSRMRAACHEAQTFSAGVAAWASPEPASRLVERADEALFQAKRDGRNRTARG